MTDNGLDRGPDRGPDAAAAITAVWRQESTRLVAALTRITRDVGLAEDLTQDALVAALEQWPATGVPARPGAWLMQVAKRRAVDHFRRAETLRRVQMAGAAMWVGCALSSSR